MTQRQPSQDHGDPILHDLTIVPFRPENHADVKRLILAGLTEHWGQLDPTKNPDLNDIGATYAHATFLVAWLHGTIVGTGALLPRSAHIAEIVRMSVAASMRRNGIGRRLLRHSQCGRRKERVMALTVFLCTPCKLGRLNRDVLLRLRASRQAGRTRGDAHGVSPIFGVSW